MNSEEFQLLSGSSSWNANIFFFCFNVQPSGFLQFMFILSLAVKGPVFDLPVVCR